MKNATDNADYLDTPDPTPQAPQLMLPERRLWCNVINLNVQAAIKGDSRSLYWLTDRNGGFLELAGMLNLHSETVTRIVEAVVSRTAKKQSRFKGNQYRPNPASLEPRKALAPPAPAPRPAIAAPVVTPSLPEIVLEPASALPWRPILTRNEKRAIYAREHYAKQQILLNILKGVEIEIGVPLA